MGTQIEVLVNTYCSPQPETLKTKDIDTGLTDIKSKEIHSSQITT